MIRSELKARGKAAFKANYWKSVLVGILLMIALGTFGVSVTRSVDVDELFDPNPAQSQSINVEDIDPLADEDFDSTDMDQDFSFLLDDQETTSSKPGGNRLKESVNTTTLGTAGGLSFILALFLLRPLEVSCRNFFKKNLHEKAELDELNRGFVPKYWNNVFTMFLRSLFNALGFLCFIIPGIVVGYGLDMVPYILADNPGIGIMDAIKASWEMMKGYKWKLFVLDLSFIGWIILDVLTLGILGIFYVNPYIGSTHAAYYEAIKAEHDVLPATPAEA